MKSDPVNAVVGSGGTVPERTTPVLDAEGVPLVLVPVLVLVLDELAGSEPG